MSLVEARRRGAELHMISLRATNEPANDRRQRWRHFSRLPSLRAADARRRAQMGFELEGAGAGARAPLASSIARLPDQVCRLMERVAACFAGARARVPGGIQN